MTGECTEESTISGTFYNDYVFGKSNAAIVNHQTNFHGVVDEFLFWSKIVDADFVWQLHQTYVIGKLL